MGYFSDKDFLERVLSLLTRDQKFLRKLSGKLSLKDFEAKKKSSVDEWARQWVGTEALKYWREYRQPIGGLLRTFALDYFRENRGKLSGEQKETLITLIEKLKQPELGVGVEAIQEKILKYKERQMLRGALEKMIEVQENGGLQLTAFREIVSAVMNKVSYDDKVTSYGETLDKRISRREKEKSDKYPLLYIECFDKAVRTIPKGQVGLILAPYKRGKSIMMAHLAQTYALQDYTSVFFTLEDPESLVEDRLDASLCGLRLASLPLKEKLLRKRFKEAWDTVRAKIFIVDATGGGWSIQRMIETVDNIRNRGNVVHSVFIDYDEQVEAMGKYSGEHALRMKSGEVWLEAVRWAARDGIWLWMAAQAKRKAEDTQIIEAADTAEDISKVRKAAIGLSIGMGPKEMMKLRDWKDNLRWLHVMVHRFGRSRMGWPIVGDFERGIFYDRQATMEAQDMYKEIMERRGRN